MNAEYALQYPRITEYALQKYEEQLIPKIFMTAGDTDLHTVAEFSKFNQAGPRGGAPPRPPDQILMAPSGPELKHVALLAAAAAAPGGPLGRRCRPCGLGPTPRAYPE